MLMKLKQRKIKITWDKKLITTYMWKTDTELLKQHEIIEQGSLLLIYCVPVFLCTFLPNNMWSIIELIESIIECERAIA